MLPNLHPRPKCFQILNELYNFNCAMVRPHKLRYLEQHTNHSVDSLISQELYVFYEFANLYEFIRSESYKRRTIIKKFKPWQWHGEKRIVLKCVNVVVRISQIVKYVRIAVRSHWDRFYRSVSAEVKSHRQTSAV